MGEPALDLSEILGPYKEDARRMIGEMRMALEHWVEVEQGGPARQALRRLAHQLRGSGRTYGFRDVTRVAKAMEHLVQKLESGRLTTDDRMRHSLCAKVDQLTQIFER